MKIKRISVYGLFGVFDHTISLNTNQRITIIHGPNGFGKTAVLRLLNSFFNSRYSELRSISFNKFKVELNDDTVIEVAREIKDFHESGRVDITFYLYKPNIERKSFSLGQVKYSPDIGFPIGILDEVVPGLERIDTRKWMYLPTDEVLSLEEVVERFGDSLPDSLSANLRGSYSKEEPVWLKDIKNAIHIRLIESQRLLNLVPSRSSRTYRGTPLMLSTVSAYSDELAKLMQDKFKEYGTTSQSLDRTFPLRVVKQQPSSDVSDEQLRNQLDELESTRSRLIEVGLLDKEEDSEFQIQPQDIDESTKNALSVYVEDVEKKLNVFSEIARKIDLLRRIINNKFAYSYKEINFSKEKGFVFSTRYKSFTDSNKLSPTDLSSGEQHELVLLYELLFKVKPNSLVLIDEPELSLHVGWQIQFLKDLQEIIELADLDILMATHSPDLIQDRWDLTVELKGPEK
ncbi:AAA family ATPase [Synechococcus elongatus]|uniref:ATPase n=2 Tax=Synechococcus elongatus TaxID=32046 RepID=Q31RV6_SYNE7|nr:AAA family ATPase [Synechococcus elongatus]ABB56213.1 ATPase [Synechococcus elongatus PCC 7942 = FACHB-805]AJD56736.1 excinuclease [Synechococcus elongatus UTEX 2973]MBD2588045.1 AAA family ATPase [Synechococcus elongatus FACHB-242]MBD2689113.1 AAA family ATPase [Synechococcus elongatus FACHB-1061]MBD2707247.1 AAA family ATPase [Synechococcus elongatus PCC 7942 = FACHB-805]